MKFIKQVLLLLLLFTALVPTVARDMSKKGDVDVKEILWGHIKDSYEWHITDLGSEGNFHPVVIHLPVIVKSSTVGTCSVAKSFQKNEMLMAIDQVPIILS